MATLVNKANSNLLAVLGFLLIVGGAITYVSLPNGSDRSVILVTLIPIATTLLLGGTIGSRLDNQDGTLQSIAKNTNGKSDAERTAIAKEAAAHVIAQLTTRDATSGVTNIVKHDDA